MRRLLATDIDGTLLAPDGSLPAVNHEVLQRLHDAGVVVVFCSGRSDASIRGIAAPILDPADDEYYIAFNGAKIVTADSRTLVSSSYVAPAAVRTVVGYARDHGLYIQGYVDDRFLVEEHTQFTDYYARATQTDYEIVSDLVTALPVGSPKLFMTADHDVLLPHRDALARMGDSGDAGFIAMFSKPHYLEVIAAGVDKGAALVHLAGILDINISDTFAVGDGDNDVAMIGAAGIGIAVNGASDAALQAATVRLESRAEEGVMPEVARLIGL